jgi:PRC-barrel domain
LTLVIAVLVAVLLVAVGTHAVMIVTAEALTRLTDSSDEEAFGDAGGAVVGDRVITESGRILGELKDVIVVGGPDPRVVAFEIGGGPPGDGLVPIGAASGLSGSALIVPDEYEQRIKTDLTGLAAELALIDEDRT